jgi:hypothetical protein
MSSAKDLLPPQARARSLDRLDAEIARAETARTRWLAKAHALEAGGLDSGYCRGLLGIAGERLEQLGRSREVLLWGENEPAADDVPA